MKKRGLSHIEMIVSFLLFIGFVSVALYFFSPTNTSRLVDSTLTYSFREIENNVSVGLNIYSVKINKDNIPSIAINIPDIDAEKKVRVEDIEGTVLPSKRDGDLVHVKLSGEKFIYIKYSRDYIPYSPVPGDGVNNIDYEIGSSSADIVVSEKRFSDLKNHYASDEGYLKLKGEEFNLPNRVDFGFSLEFDDGSKIEAEKNIPAGVEVFSDIKQVPVIRKEKKSESGEIIVEDGKSELANIIVEVW